MSRHFFLVPEIIITYLKINPQSSHSIAPRVYTSPASPTIPPLPPTAIPRVSPLLKKADKVDHAI